VWPPEKWMPKEIVLPEKNRRKQPRLYYAEKQAKAATAAPKPASDTKESPKGGGLFGLSANQWIGIGGIGVSLAGLYSKREELMAMANAASDKIRMPKPAPEPASAEPKSARNTRPRGLKRII